MITIINLAYNLKKRLGKWYTVFLTRILPFVIYAIPINILIARTSDWLVAKFLPGIADLLRGLRSPYFLTVWLITLLLFLIILIKLPKAATVVEFVLGFAYFIVAFRFGYFNLLGNLLIIAISVFLFFKLLFLIANIMYRIEYGYDENERGESGRRVKKSDSDYFFG